MLYFENDKFHRFYVSIKIKGPNFYLILFLMWPVTVQTYIHIHRLQFNCNPEYPDISLKLNSFKNDFELWAVALKILSMSTAIANPQILKPSA